MRLVVHGHAAGEGARRVREFDPGRPDRAGRLVDAERAAHRQVALPAPDEGRTSAFLELIRDDGASCLGLPSGSGESHAADMPRVEEEQCQRRFVERAEDRAQVETAVLPRQVAEFGQRHRGSRRERRQAPFTVRARAAIHHHDIPDADPRGVGRQPREEQLRLEEPAGAHGSGRCTRRPEATRQAQLLLVPFVPRHGGERALEAVHVDRRAPQHGVGQRRRP